MDHYVNPYIAGSPVTGTEMFYGRMDVFAFIERNLIGQHRDTPVVLYGQRRTGKTSVLYQLHRHLNDSYRCVFVDLHGLNLRGIGNLLFGIANSISRALRRDHQLAVEVPDRVTFLSDPRSAFETLFLDKVLQTLNEDHLVLMLDEVIRLDEEVKAGRLEREIFDYLRHLMQHHARLNFVFSLGSGLEEMARDYAFLFSVSLYHRISFLESSDARRLITKPACEHYRITPEAVERILEVTSGHPYYTQLVCHCLFDLWSRCPKEEMNVGDVETILAEAIELGSANLTHVWEDSTPGEKALMAGIAASMRRGPGPVSIDLACAAWRDLGVSVPEREVARALRGLISREVIAGNQSYSFAVDLQRLWLEKHRHLDWVKDEIAETVELWNKAAKPWAAKTIPVRGHKPVLEIGARIAHSRLRNMSGVLVRARLLTKRRNYLLAASIIAAVAAFLVATSAARIFPFSSPASGIDLMPGLIQLLPGDQSQNEHNCHLTTAPTAWSAPGLVQAVHCTNPNLKGGNIYAYQLDSLTDFQTSWLNFNHWWRFPSVRVVATCPPRGATDGQESLSSKNSPPADRQVLECGLLDANNGIPVYVVSFPTNDTFIVAVGAAGSSFAALDYWMISTSLQCCGQDAASSGG